MKESKRKDWNKSGCTHTQLCSTCDYCDDVIIKLSSYNAVNLMQILDNICKGNLQLQAYDKRFCINILKEMTASTYRLNPRYLEYSPITKETNGCVEK